MRLYFISICLIVILANSGKSQDTQESIENLINNDTLLHDEIQLDTVKFYLFEDLAKLENTIRDTFNLKINGIVYKVPYKINAQTIIDYQKQFQNYKLSGLSLYANPELEYFIKELFRQPRTKLLEKISPKDWPRSEIYLRYFEKYDKNSQNLEGNEVNTEIDEDELEDDDVANENYVDFPLPETIDIFVNLKGNPKVVTILGVEFDFNKLDPRFQKILMGYGGIINSKNRKSDLK